LANQLNGVCFVEKQNYEYNDDSDKLGIKVDEEDVNVYLKVYFNLNQPEIPFVYLSVELKNTLKDILNKLISEGYIITSNSHSYYFVEHNSEPSQTIDNELNMNMEMKYLNSFELDVFIYLFSFV
jgi:hypothetical protein